MLTEFATGLSSLKAASDMIKGLNAANTQAAINDAKIELQEHIIEAREALTTVREQQEEASRRIRELENELAQLKSWDAEKDRYELKPIDQGAFAYVLKSGKEDGEPAHWLCTNCFNRGDKSFLQFKGQERGPNGRRAEHSVYGCDRCKATVKVYYARNPSKPWQPEAN